MIKQAEVRDRCPVAEAHGRYSKTTGIAWGAYDRLVRIVKRDGSDGFRLECSVCDTHALDERLWPKEIRRDWVEHYRAAGVQVHESMSWEQRRGTFVPNPPCAVADCGEAYTQLHHFAPQAVFGYRSGQWPTSYLCVAHHHEWHTLMCGYQWQAIGLKAVAA